MKLSVKFAKAKWEVIEHLRYNVLPINRALAKTQFPVMINKVVTELKGEIKEHTFSRPTDGKEITTPVIMFPDGSFAKRPNIEDLLRVQR
jgi:hypothetical protein